MTASHPAAPQGIENKTPRPTKINLGQPTPGCSLISIPFSSLARASGPLWALSYSYYYSAHTTSTKPMAFILVCSSCLGSPVHLSMAASFLSLKSQLKCHLL